MPNHRPAIVHDAAQGKIFTGVAVARTSMIAFACFPRLIVLFIKETSPFYSRGPLSKDSGFRHHQAKYNEGLQACELNRPKIELEYKFQGPE